MIVFACAGIGYVDTLGVAGVADDSNDSPLSIVLWAIVGVGVGTILLAAFGFVAVWYRRSPPPAPWSWSFDLS